MKNKKTGYATCIIIGCESIQYGKIDYCSRHARQKREGTLSLELRTCKECSVLLPVHFRPDQLFCSQPCRMKFHRKSGSYTKERMLVSRGPCSIDGCNSPLHANKLCQRHNNNLRRNGNPLISHVRKKRGVCAVPECGRIHFAKNFCAPHYHSYHTYGDPLYVDTKPARNQSKKPEYYRWIGMKSRCNNPKAGNYGLYGAKDIKVSKEWNHDFEQFLKDVGPMPGPDYHLARKDHKKNYEAGNVEWKMKEENSRYHSGVHLSYDLANEIRNLYPTLTMQCLSKKYNVTIGHISKILNNEAWSEKDYMPSKNRRRSKLNEEQKNSMMLDRKNGLTLKQIGDKYKVSESGAHMIVRHGFRGRKASHPLYHVWTGMMRRCYEVNNTSYNNYGAKGVSVDKGWHDFYVFIEDIPQRPSKNYSLDRIDPVGNYEPGNVKWSTSFEQNKNKRNSKFERQKNEI